MAIDIPEFHTAVCRRFALECAARIEGIKENAIMFAVEPDGTQAERVGTVRGLKAAIEIAVELDKELAGVSNE